MKTLKILLLLFMSGSSSLISMENTASDHQAPSGEAFRRVFPYISGQELTAALCLSKSLNAMINSDEFLWASILNRCASTFGCPFQDPSMGLKKIVQSNMPKAVAKRVLTMENWSKEQLAELLIEEKYQTLEKNLVKNLETKITQRLGTVDIPDQILLVSAILAMHAVTAFLDRSAREMASSHASDNVLLSYYAYETQLWRAYNEIFLVIIAITNPLERWNYLRELDHFFDGKNIKQTVAPVISSVLKKLAMEEADVVGEKYQLAKIYTLAVVAQDTIMNDLLEVVDRFANLTVTGRSNNNIVAALARSGWNQSSKKSNNNYIESLQRIVQKIPRAFVDAEVPRS